MKKKAYLKVILWIVIGIITLVLLDVGLQHHIDIGDFLSRTMVYAAPLLLGTLGEIYAERSGITNLGVEGLIATGAILGVIGAFTVKNPWGGVLLAIVGCGFIAFLFGLVVVKLQGMQIPAGLGLYMFGLGFSGVVGRNYIGKTLPYHFSSFPVPGLKDVPIFGKFLFTHGPLVYLSLLLVPILWFILFKTRLGLQIRSVGENPSAADSGGVNVFMIRYLCIVIGGVLAGLAGCFLSLSLTPGWTEGMSAGKGWLVIALTILSLWGPLRALFWSLLFGGVYVLQYELQGYGIPPQILGMLPFLLTLIFLAIFLVVSEESGAPSALLEPYSRE